MFRSSSALRFILAAAAVAPLSLGVPAFAQSTDQTTPMAHGDAMAPAAKSGMSHDGMMHAPAQTDAMRSNAMRRGAMSNGSMSHGAMANQPHR